MSAAADVAAVGEAFVPVSGSAFKIFAEFEGVDFGGGFTAVFANFRADDCASADSPADALAEADDTDVDELNFG